jgi:hypothetical protein
LPKKESDSVLLGAPVRTAGDSRILIINASLHINLGEGTRTCVRGKEAHDLGITVVVWTVNEPGQIKKMLDLGVDGLISDRPDLVRQAAAERGMALPSPTSVQPDRIFLGNQGGSDAMLLPELVILEFLS